MTRPNPTCPEHKNRRINMAADKRQDDAPDGYDSIKIYECDECGREGVVKSEAGLGGDVTLDGELEEGI